MLELERVTASIMREVQCELEEIVARSSGALVEPIRGIVCRPSKLLRPRLLAVAADCQSGREVVTLGAVVELAHVGSLIHDDIIDKADDRRFGRSVHADLGPEMATLSGAMCVSLALFEAASFNADVCDLVTRAVQELSDGELRDVERAYDISLPMDVYLEGARAKTGALFGLSCELGSLAVTGDFETALRFGRFGRAFGVAFQILDDCQDVRGGREGKPSGSDNRYGLFGLPTLLAVRSRGHPSSSAALRRILLTVDTDESELRRAREIVLESGGVERAEAIALEIFAESARKLAVGKMDGRTSRLIELAESALEARRVTTN